MSTFARKTLATGAGTIAFFLFLGVFTANAQAFPSTCPAANVFYSNGYSVSPCIPSYYPGYPQTTVYIPPGGTQMGNGYYYGPGTVVTNQYNPFTPPVTDNNGIFAPYQTFTAPTYFYPVPPTTPPSTNGPFYNPAPFDWGNGNWNHGGGNWNHGGGNWNHGGCGYYQGGYGRCR